MNIDIKIFFTILVGYLFLVLIMFIIVFDWATKGEFWRAIKADIKNLFKRK